MNNKRVFIGMIALTILLTGAIIGSAVLGNMFLKKHTARLVELKLEDKVIQNQQIALTAAKKDIEKYSELETIAKSIVPQDKDQVKTVRDIVKIAEENNIRIESVTFPSSTLGSKPAVTTPAPEGSAAPATPVVPPVSQAKPVAGLNGVYSLQLEVLPSNATPINYNELISFLKRLENNRRTAQISRINITPKGNKLGFSLSINIFIKP